MSGEWLSLCVYLLMFQLSRVLSSHHVTKLCQSARALLLDALSPATRLQPPTGTHSILRSAYTPYQSQNLQDITSLAETSLRGVILFVPFYQSAVIFSDQHNLPHDVANDDDNWFNCTEQTLMFPGQSPAESRVHVTESGTLSIQSARVEDSGEYSCQALNAAGSSFANAHITVTGLSACFSL